jgi:hypothetical protein
MQRRVVDALGNRAGEMLLVRVRVCSLREYQVGSGPSAPSGQRADPRCEQLGGALDLTGREKRTGKHEHSIAVFLCARRGQS